MKIQSSGDFQKFVTQVRDRPDADGRSSRQQGQSGQNPNQKHPEERDPKAMEAEVDAAMVAFGTDAQAQTHQLSVNREGQGPGLRVTLKDGSGAVVRQFTGEEFLRLRVAASYDTRSRGKILDRKL